MNQHGFEQRHERQWRTLEEWLDRQTDRKTQQPKGKTDSAPIDFPRLYRQVCHHLALAKDRRFSPHLIERLNRLVMRGHEALYQRRGGALRSFARFLAVGFPNLVRREKALVGLATLLFFGPLLAMTMAIQYKPELVYSVLDAADVVEMERMYDPSLRKLGRERQADTDFAMFGFYIRNNVSIGFQTFAGGLLLGLGTLFFLLYNGFVIGAVAGHLTGIGYTATFWGFVAGHSAPELLAIVLSGAAGLRLGAALLKPGRRTRLDALRLAGLSGAQLVAGAAAMFIFAAVIEAFWSSTTALPVTLKYAVGIALWGAFLAYFCLAGRVAASNQGTGSAA